MSTPSAYVVPSVESTAVFQPDIFKGKVLFCTGGGSGICRGMTHAMMNHGANAAIVGRNLERLAQSAKELSDVTKRTCIPVQADVRHPQALRDAVARTVEQFGRIDFVICGAAGNFLAPISGLSENGFKTVMEIDTLGAYNTIKATLQHIRASKGAYIHVSATLHYRAVPYQAHVSAAKAAVDALSAVLAIEEGPHGVRSNVIAPGPIAGTEGIDRLTPSSPSQSPSAPMPTDLPPNHIRRTLPAGRLGTVQDIGNATVFLFSDAAAFITGQVVVVDGGSEHLREGMLPYPQAVLDPGSVRGMIKGKM